MAAVTASVFVAFSSFFVFVAAEQKIITAESRQNVTLPCRAPNYNKIIIVEWSRTDLEPEYVLLYQDGKFVQSYQHPSFKNRVDLQDRQMKDGDASLILKDVTINDAGTYECHVFMTGTNNAPISIIYLSVSPPGPTGGATEDEEEDGGKEDGSVGLIVGLLVAALLFVAAVGFLIYRKCKPQSQGPYQPPAELPDV